VGECVREQQVVKFNILQGVVQDLGLSGIVDLKQNVPFSKMKELYLRHHFFVLPARDEQYGVSVTEALGYGLPAICSDTCGARFNIQDGENGYVVKSDSLEELTDAMEKLLSDKTRLSRMSENSLDYVHKHLSGTAYYSRFSHVLQDRFQLQPNDKMPETPSFEYQ
jgi:glycosyltransferase involved in cell wall biosynthesis